MYEAFLQKFNEKVPITLEDEAILKQSLLLKKLRKKQYLLQEGDICRHICIVEKGALRAYVLDESGNERITAFALEGWTIADLYSFVKQEPATLNIDAMEDASLVLISKEAHEELLRKMPKYEAYFRILVTEAYIALQKRTTNMISLPLEERYMALVDMYPSIIQRVPQHMIASYMGLSRETLSRVRAKISNRK